MENWCWCLNYFKQGIANWIDYIRTKKMGQCFLICFSDCRFSLPEWSCGSPEWKLHRWFVWSTRTRPSKSELLGSLAGGGWWESEQHGKEPWSPHRKDNPRPAERSVQETIKTFVKCCASASPWIPHLSLTLYPNISSPQLVVCQCRGRWTSVTPPESICQDTGPWAVLLQEL